MEQTKLITRTIYTDYPSLIEYSSTPSSKTLV